MSKGPFLILRIEDPISFWLILLERLWNGEGTAIDMRAKEIAMLPKISEFYQPPVFLENDTAIVVYDAKESLIEVLKKILEAAFYSTNTEEGSFTYSSSNERILAGIETISTALYIRGIWGRSDIERLEREDLDKVVEGVKTLIGIA
jgi:hypothetical protein